MIKNAVSKQKTNMAASVETFESDAFDDDMDDKAFSVETNSWKKLEDHCRKDGYREGLEEGEEQTLQAGHDRGFQQASSFFHLAALRGVLAALRCCIASQHLETNGASLSEELNALETHILHVERGWEENSSGELGAAATSCGPSAERTQNAAELGSPVCAVQSESTRRLLAIINDLLNQSRQDMYFTCGKQRDQFHSVVMDVQQLIQRLLPAS